jgi:hypothetical protein
MDIEGFLLSNAHLKEMDFITGRGKDRGRNSGDIFLFFQKENK